MTDRNWGNLWRYHGDDTPEKRVRRVLGEHGVEWWDTTGTIRFTTMVGADVVRDVEHALGEGDALVEVDRLGALRRYRVDI